MRVAGDSALGRGGLFFLPFPKEWDADIPDQAIATASYCFSATHVASTTCCNDRTKTDPGNMRGPIVICLPHVQLAV